MAGGGEKILRGKNNPAVPACSATLCLALNRPVWPVSLRTRANLFGPLVASSHSTRLPRVLTDTGAKEKYTHAHSHKHPHTHTHEPKLGDP